MEQEQREHTCGIYLSSDNDPHNLKARKGMARTDKLMAIRLRIAQAAIAEAIASAMTTVEPD